MARNKPYHKLPGRGSYPLTYSRLYRAENHILQVLSTGFTESYLRFYFRDIQLITIRKTHSGKIVNAILAAIILIFSSMAFTPGGEIAAAIMVGICGIPLLFNIALGPSCVTHVQTVVQRQKLSSLGRLWTARKILKILQPHLEAAQGQLPEEDLDNLLGARATGSPTASLAPSSSVFPDAGSSLPSPADPAPPAPRESE